MSEREIYEYVFGSRAHGSARVAPADDGSSTAWLSTEYGAALNLYEK